MNHGPQGNVSVLARIQALLFAFLFFAGVANAADQPNLVFIIADDCTFRDLGCYGGQAKTPNIDALAEQGMQFASCFQAAPMCSPTRHNIYTGLYPVKSGAYPNHTFANSGVKSVAHYLKPLGYRVALSGKTHIGPKETFPFEYSGKKNPDMLVIDKLMEESVAAKSPFCLFACSNEPHSPWNKGDASQYPVDKIVLPPYIVDTPVVREAFANYLAEITYYDSQVGEILALLDKHKIADNTMVMVVSEQGNSFPFAKWTCYSSGLQSAMIVRWPGHVQPGSKTAAMVEYTDVTPTFVDAAGGKPIDGLDGRSFVSVLKGETEHHKDFSYGLMTTRGIINGTDQYAIRTIRDKRYRLIWNLNHQAKFQNACTKANYFKSMVAKADGGDKNAKLLVDKYHYRPEFELYDCDADPLEMNNLAGDTENAKIVARLKQQLESWMAEQGDLGKQTEIEAVMHQGRYRGMSREEALEAFASSAKKGKKKSAEPDIKKKRGKKKNAAK